MSMLKCVVGQDGSGKRAYVVQRCHVQILGDQAHIRPRLSKAKCIGYFTPLYEPNPAHAEDVMHSLAALDTLYDGFDLSNPVDWKSIDLNRYRHIVFDGVRFDDNGTGTQPCDLYAIRSIEFTMIELCGLFKKARRRDVPLTLITDTVPALWAQAFTRAGVKDIQFGSGRKAA